ncbi:Fe-S cluster assembly protein SufD [Salinisphaera sp. Q1T1-3]|uniref:Fe-S cluster assembly protein SufD n=1 Tax=Salinisphaera sp. Q1T1-3 TaxID=2321229 RepID=UPI000E734880|nr:Fe-S cluster assembly protein SufD [Salinisphaera sp. Q1T1-3]RJS95314.1 Fe-S cluster assembly protein SufD [Salinisphaera sp. Q1T1-3]
MSAVEQIEPSIDHYLAEYARVERDLPGSDESKRGRSAELARFAEAGFPNTRQEDWKYTSLAPVEKRRFELSDTPHAIGMDDIAAFLPEGLEAYRLVLVDGHFVAGLSDLDRLPEGVTVRSFAAWLNDNAGATVKAAQISEEPGSLSAMNAALFTDGAYIETAAGAVLDKPLHVISVASGAVDERMTQVRHRYVMGENSQATIVEHAIGLGDKAYFANAVTEAVMGRNAQLTRVRLQQESGRGYHVSSFFAEQRRDSRVYNHGVDLGGRLARINTNTRLVDQNAEVHFNGVYLPTGRQHIDNHTRIEHATEHSISRERYKGVLAGHGRGVFNGMILIQKDAQKTDSDLSCDALLLSDKAEVDAKPELEIYADDVTAGHGSTVGQLDEDAVFYLKSRGVDEEGARAILTYSFAKSLIEQIGMPAVARYVEAAMLVKLPGGTAFADLA